MPLTIVQGRSSSGKTEWIYSAIERAKADGRECILIVPEQSTYEAELALMDRMDGQLMGVEVLSLARLAQRVLNKVGGKTRFFLSADGKRMVIRKILEERKSKLSLLGQDRVQRGLTEYLDRLIADCKSEEISVQALKDAAIQLDDEYLNKKISDIATVYEGLEEFMAGRYIDAEDRQALLIEKMSGAEYLSKIELFIDGFSGKQYTKQAYEIIKKMMTICLNVTISLRLCEVTDADSNIFSRERNVLIKLLASAKELGLDENDILRIKLEQKKNRPAAIEYLEQNAFAYSNKLGPKDSSFRYLAAVNRREEVAAAAQAIDELLRGGSKCADIVVAVTDMDAYAPLLRRELAHLPYFLDQGRSLATHGVVELSISALEACQTSFRIEEVLRVAKSGFSPLYEAELDDFESYVLRNGIRFLDPNKEFTRIDDSDPLLHEKAAVGRAIILDLLVKLRERLRESDDTQGHCEALFRFYEDLQLREKLQEFCEEWQNRGEHDIAEENSQVWNAVLALLDQIALLLKGNMSVGRFCTILQEGFLSHEIGMIPPSADQISVSTVKRIAVRSQAKHVFILGCNEGLLPRSVVDEGMIDDGDIEKLCSVGLDVFEDSRKSTLSEKQIVYALLSHPTESLWMSWAESDESGQLLIASSIAERVKQLFPYDENIAKRASNRPDEQSNVSAAFSMSVQGLRSLADSGKVSEGIETAYSYFSSEHGWLEPLSLVEERLFGLPNSMKAENAAIVYTKRQRESASRIELFNQCPFKHFIRYGLQPEEGREHKEELSDVGNFYHEVLDLFTRRMIDSGRDWAELTREETESIVEEIIAGVQVEHNKGILLETARERARLQRMSLAAKQSVWAMVQQIVAGDYRPVASEAKLGEEVPMLKLQLSNSEIIELVGKIDRIDSYQSDKGKYIRIIDYKSGNQNFSFSELYHGVKLQLPLYMKAALALGEASGMFYLHITEGDVQRSDLDDEESAEAALQKKYRLKGILVLDDEGEIPRAMDRNCEGASDVIPLQYKNDSSPRKSESLVPIGMMNIILDRAEEKAIESIERIMDGETRTYPFIMGNKTACDYCDYKSICRFEKKDANFNVIEKMKAEDFFDRCTTDESDGAEVRE